MDDTIDRIAKRVRSGDVSATRVIEEALERAVASDRLNAFITLDTTGALKKAGQIDSRSSAAHSGDLLGVPIVVKDNIDVANLRTTAGTPGIDYVPVVSAPMVARLEKAGAIVIGKTNMHELAFGVTSNNQCFGAVRNPSDPTRFPGGSSGGTAAAIAAGIVPAGLGTDTAGSVRDPAALCGVAGFRPTTWQVAQEGVVPSAPTFDVVGSMASRVADLAILNTVMTDCPTPAQLDAKGLRFGVATPQTDNLSDGVAAAFDTACSRLSVAGISLVDVNLSSIVEQSFDIGYPIAFYEMKREMTAFLKKKQPQTRFVELVEKIASEDVKAIYLDSVVGDNGPTEAAYLQAIGRIDHIRRDYAKILDSLELDGVLWPTVPLEAQLIERSMETVVLNGEVVPIVPTFVRNAVTASICAAPGISIPMGVNHEGLPIGLELDGRPDEDFALLSAAITVEAIVA
ncbi:MAG: amidase family protein [Rubripirellula sp.]